MRFMWICKGMMNDVKLQMKAVKGKKKETPIQQHMWRKSKCRPISPRLQWTVQLQLRIIRYYTCQNWLLFIIEREKEMRCDSRTHTSYSLFYINAVLVTSHRVSQPASKQANHFTQWEKRKRKSQFVIWNGVPFTMCKWEIFSSIQHSCNNYNNSNTIRINRMICGFVAVRFVFSSSRSKNSAYKKSALKEQNVMWINVNVSGIITFCTCTHKHLKYY